MNYNLIFACLSGSHLYGTNRPDSDYDIRGVCFPLPENILGIQKFEQWQPNKDEAVGWTEGRFGIESDDVCIYSLEKFVKLCGNANPNIIELLFAEPLEKSDTWDEIINHREWFLSQKIIHTFAGYAYSQLKRIKTHRRWIEMSPEKPCPEDYGYQDGDWTSRNRKNEYSNKLSDYSSYQTWLKTRNPKRLALELEYGYDSKHAMHLYRLIIECETLLLDGKLEFPLSAPHREILSSVYNGEFSYDEIVWIGEGCKDALMKIPTDLPYGPDWKKINMLLIKLQRGYLLRGV